MWGCLITAGKARHGISVLKELKYTCFSHLKTSGVQLISNHVFSPIFFLLFVSSTWWEKQRLFYFICIRLHLCGSADWSTKPGPMQILLLVVEPSGGSQRYQAHTGSRSEPRRGAPCLWFASLQSCFFLGCHRGPTSGLYCVSGILLWVLAWKLMKNRP